MLTTISLLFDAILKDEQNLQLHENLADYYTKRERFTHNLNVFINQTNFSTLSAQELLQLCGLVGTYRPMQPHSFLSRCSQLIHPVGADKV